MLEPTVDGWYVIGNLAFGGLIGYLIVDSLSGAMYKLPRQFAVNLETNSQDQFGLFIMTLDSLTAEQRQHLEPIDLEG